MSNGRFLFSNTVEAYMFLKKNMFCELQLLIKHVMGEFLNFCFQIRSDFDELT